MVHLYAAAALERKAIRAGRFGIPRTGSRRLRNRRRIPSPPAEESVLYGVVAGHLETFLARQRERGQVVPRFVERELRSFLDCGVLARGFLRVHCDACGLDRVVPFSRKGR